MLSQSEMLRVAQIRVFSKNDLGFSTRLLQYLDIAQIGQPQRWKATLTHTKKVAWPAQFQVLFGQNESILGTFDGP